VRTAARIALTIVVLLMATVVMPRPGVGSFVPEALAQIIATPTPSNSPTPTQSPTTPYSTPTPYGTPTPPPPDGDGGGKGDGTGNGHNGGTGGNGRDKDRTGAKGGGAKNPHESGNDNKTPKERTKERAGHGKGHGKGQGKGHGKGKVEVPIPTGTFTPAGAFDSEKLVSIANQLHALGMPMSQIMKKVYAPFIIGGRAAFTNTWGAPRYGPGPIVRTHEGQDVFCTYGDPVLASEAGTIDYGNQSLGGRVARLFRADGSYWYYAHLSDWNDNEFPEGSRVEAGDVVGFCGNTGNAIATPSHVHFGWYQGLDGKAKDPMGYLVRWLHEAQRRALGVVYHRQGKLEKANEALTAQRRFGDDFVPHVGDKSAQALLVAALPSTGAFEVARSQVVAAISQNRLEPISKQIATAASPVGVPARGSPEAQLDAILDEIGHGSAQNLSSSSPSQVKH
jgi:murein DD-endopeptidase MepM/ murein hydrolase activator NlpD